MLDLSNLPIFDSFSVECNNAVAQGDFRERIKVWTLSNLETGSELHTKLSYLYNLLGVPTNQGFATTKTNKCAYKKGSAYAPCIYKDQEGNLSIQWGFTFIPLYFSEVPPIDPKSKTYDASFWIYGYPSDSPQVAIPIELTYEFKEVKDFQTRKEMPNLILKLSFECAGLSDQISFKVIYNSNFTIEDKIKLQNLVSAQYTLRKDKEKAAKNVEQVNELLSRAVKTTALPVLKPSANLNRIMLPVFNQGKMLEFVPENQIVLPFTSFSLKQSQNPYYVLDVDTSPIVEKFGDYEVEGFGKKMVKLSEVSKIAINQNNSLGEQFDDHPPQAGILFIKNASERDTSHIPECTLLLISQMSPEVKAIYGITSSGQLESSEVNKEFEAYKQQRLKAITVNPEDLV